MGSNAGMEVKYVSENESESRLELGEEPKKKRKVNALST